MATFDLNDDQVVVIIGTGAGGGQFGGVGFKDCHHGSIGIGQGKGVTAARSEQRGAGVAGGDGEACLKRHEIGQGGCLG